MPSGQLSESLTLFLYAGDVPSQDSHVDLSVYGSTGSGKFTGCDLYTYSDASGNILSSYIPLYVTGPSFVSDSDNIPLWVYGELPSSYASFPLTVWNQQSGDTLSLPLYISGEGVNPGYLSYNESLNLFIQRPLTGYCSLYTQGPGIGSSGLFTMYVCGNQPASGLFNMSLPNAVGFGQKSSNLYTSGW